MRVTKNQPERPRNYLEDHLRTTVRDTDDCSICYLPLTFANARITPCGHVFCEPCITRAVSDRDSCPTCRFKGLPAVRYLEVRKIPKSGKRNTALVARLGRKLKSTLAPEFGPPFFFHHEVEADDWLTCLECRNDLSVEVILETKILDAVERIAGSKRVPYDTDYK